MPVETPVSNVRHLKVALEAVVVVDMVPGGTDPHPGVGQDHPLVVVTVVAEGAVAEGAVEATGITMRVPQRQSSRSESC